MGKKGELDKAEQGVGKGELVSPLQEAGRKGGNPLSPELGAPKPFEPSDPLGILPSDAEGRGKRGGAY